MTLTLFTHPLALFCHKVLIALYENETPFEARTVDFGDPDSAAALRERWPMSKIPTLHDQKRERTVPETSIIIEYLHEHYPGPVPLLPESPDKRLEARLWDRFFDLYVATPVQKIVGDRLRPESQKDPQGVEDARAALDMAYKMIERQVSSREWAVGDSFTMADCSAAPALFYASIVHPFGDSLQNLQAYFDRLVARPSVTRVIAEARPYFPMFPYNEAIPTRFLAE